MTKNQEIFSIEKEISALKKELKLVDKMDIILNRGLNSRSSVAIADGGLEYPFDIYSISNDLSVAIQEKKYIDITSKILKENLECIVYKTDIRTMTEINSYLKENEMDILDLFNTPLTELTPGTKVRGTKAALEHVEYKFLDKYDESEVSIKKIIFLKDSIGELEKALREIGMPDSSASDYPFYFTEFDKKTTKDFTNFNLDDIKIKDGKELKNIFIKNVINQKETLYLLQKKGIDCSKIVKSSYAVLAAGNKESIAEKTTRMANGFEKNLLQSDNFINMVQLVELTENKIGIERDF